MNPLDHIEDLHNTWNALTGQNLRLLGIYEHEYGWHEFDKAGFTKEDLVLVVRSLQRAIAKGERKLAALKWRNVIGNLALFDDERQMATAQLRVKKPTPLQREMNTLRPVAVPVTPQQSQISAVPVSDLIANLKRAAGMRV